MSEGSPKRVPKHPIGSSSIGNYPIQKGIRERVLDYLQENGATSRKVIIKDLNTQFNYLGDQVSDAIKALKKQKRITKVRRGVYLAGRIENDFRTTHGQGPSSGTPPTDRAFKILDTHPRIHNIMGFVSVRDWGNLPKAHQGKRHFTDTTNLDMYNGSYIKLLRQGDTLQFWMANKRPAFHRLDILPLMTKLDEILEGWGIKGTTWYHQIEFRNETDEVVLNLKGNPIEETIIQGYIARIYEGDDGKLQKEIRHNGGPYSRDEILNMIINLNTAMSQVEAVATIADGVTRIESRFDNMHRDVSEKYENLYFHTQEASDEFQRLRGETEYAAMKLAAMETQWKRYNEQVDSLHYKIFDATQMIEKSGTFGTGGLSQKPESVFSDPEVQLLFQQQNNILERIADRMDAMDQEIKEVKEEVKDLNNKQQNWRDIDTAARIETIHEYKALNMSWQKIADFLNTSKGTIWKYHDRHCNCHKDGNEGVVPKVDTPQISHEEYLKNEYGVSIKEHHIIQVEKVMKVLGQSYSDQVISILHHIKESNVRARLSDLVNKGVLSAQKEGRRKKYQYRRKKI